MTFENNFPSLKNNNTLKSEVTVNLYDENVISQTCLDKVHVREAIEKISKRYGWHEIYMKEVLKELGIEEK